MINIRCASCGMANDQHSAMPDMRPIGPREGDVSICLYCAKVGIFTQQDGQWKLREPTPGEQRELDADPQVRRALQALLDLHVEMSGKEKSTEEEK